MVLAVIVGTSMEQSFRRAYKIADGDMHVFVRSPLCIILIVLTIAVIVLPVVQKKLKASKKVA